MTNDIQLANGALSAICAVVLTLLVLNHRVKDGVVIKAGLIAMIGSFIITAMLTFDGSRDWQAYSHAHLLNRVGLLIAVAGVWMRFHKFLHRSKKNSDAHSPRTNQILSGMTSQASDLMDLLYDSKPRVADKEKNH